MANNLAPGILDGCLSGNKIILMNRNTKWAAIILLIIVAIVLTFGGAFAQSTIWTVRNRENPKMLIADSSLKVPAVNFLYAPYSNKDSIGRIWLYTNTGEFYGQFPGNIKKAFATKDSVQFLRDSSIRNQNLAPQTADYAISGVGSSSRYTAFNTAGIPFIRYFSFAHHGVDTLQQRWSFGLSGTPLASGPPNNGGDSLTFRSYTTAGTVANDVMTLYRGGGARIPVSLTVGRLGFGGTPLVVNGSASIFSSLSIGSTLTVTNNSIFQGAIAQNQTVTPTSDYTVVSTDVYVNVNNTANCTITIPAPVFGTGSGRILRVKKISNNAFTVNIVVSGGANTIDGSAAVLLSAYNSSIALHDDGLNWYAYDRSSFANTLEQVLTAGNTSTLSMAINGTGAFGGGARLGATSFPSSTLSLDGSFAPLIVTITTTITAANFYGYNVNNTSNIIINLPAASSCPYRQYLIKKISNNANTITITPASGTIETAATYVMSVYLGSRIIYNDGTNWWVQ